MSNLSHITINIQTSEEDKKNLSRILASGARFLESEDGIDGLISAIVQIMEYVKAIDKTFADLQRDIRMSPTRGQ